MANIQIPISENGTITLATAGKYCDRNIDIHVDAAGNGVETATLTFSNNQNWSNTVLYVNEAQEIASVTITPQNTMELMVVKNSIIYINAIDEIAGITGEIKKLINTNLYFVSADCTFTTKESRD